MSNLVICSDAKGCNERFCRHRTPHEAIALHKDLLGGLNFENCDEGRAYCRKAGDDVVCRKVKDAK